MKRVIVTGATGFIGKALCFRLAEEGYEVVALTRSLEKGKKLFGNKATAAKWDGQSAETWLDFVDGALAIVNLALRL